MNKDFELSHWKLHRTPGNILLVAKELPLAEADLPLALAKHALSLNSGRRARFRAKVLSHPDLSNKQKDKFVEYLGRRPSHKLREMHSAQVKKLARKLARDPCAGGTAAERKLKERFLKEIRRHIH